MSTTGDEAMSSTESSDTKTTITDVAAVVAIDTMSNDATPTTKSSSLSSEQRRQIREQMEFYFSDSNLSKDRFLKQEVATSSNDGFIDLAVFLRFNKIRLLTTRISELARAIKRSDFIELNEASTMVRRVKPFVEPSQHDMDKKTIYVENIKADSTSDTLKRDFERFGRVAYVSLPKFQSSNQLKGFAFIEFYEKEGAKNAVNNELKFFKSASEESASSDEPKQSIGKFPKANAQIIDLEKRIQKVKSAMVEFLPTPEPTQDQSGKKEDGAEHNEKRKIVATSKDEIATKACKRATVSSQEDQKMELEVEASSDSVFANLSVVSKKAWLKLRDDFLNKQKQEIVELKKKLAELTQKLEELRVSHLKAKNANVKTDDIVRGCVIKLTIHATNEAEYALFKLTRQQFKEQKLAAGDLLSHVAYVDIEKSLNRILIRCHTPEAAKTLLESAQFLPELSEPKRLLVGKEEDEYFERIIANRSKKLEKKDRKHHNKTETSDPSNTTATKAAAADLTCKPKQNVPATRTTINNHRIKAEKTTGSLAMPTKTASRITFDDEDEHDDTNHKIISE